ncbi:MAG: rhodanese-like domain-containing protein [Planctomycetota bacterium]|nr:rhodanese-like domain-containing protein [Planctomycetota bacterium]
MNHGQPVKRFARRARAGMLCALLLAGAPDLACGQETPLRPAHGEPPAPAAYARPELLVETAQLAAWIGKDPKNPAEPKLVVVDARPAEGFRSGHLPGAVNIESDPLQDTKRPRITCPAPKPSARSRAPRGSTPTAAWSSTTPKAGAWPRASGSRFGRAATSASRSSTAG